MSADPSIRLSKALSLLLRHEPGRFGVALDGAGWAEIAAIVVGLRSAGVEVDEESIRDVVRRSDKQRFATSDDGLRIRASQGHSVDVDVGLEPREPPHVLYHGTVVRFLASIRERGLVSKERQHVHLSADVDLARDVGARRGDPVLLEIDARAMAADRHVFYVSANGVWLTRRVPPQYVSERDTPRRSSS